MTEPVQVQIRIDVRDDDFGNCQQVRIEHLGRYYMFDATWIPKDRYAWFVEVLQRQITSIVDVAVTEERKRLQNLMREAIGLPRD